MFINTPKVTSFKGRISNVKEAPPQEAFGVIDMVGTDYQGRPTDEGNFTLNLSETLSLYRILGDMLDKWPTGS